MERTQLKPSPDLVAAFDQEDGGASAPFRILSLDGGGYKGMFTAAILDRLAADLKVDLLSHVDLLAGTSPALSSQHRPIRPLRAVCAGKRCPPAPRRREWIRQRPPRRRLDGQWSERGLHRGGYDLRPTSRQRRPGAIPELPDCGYLADVKSGWEESHRRWRNRLRSAACGGCFRRCRAHRLHEKLE